MCVCKTIQAIVKFVIQHPDYTNIRFNAQYTIQIWSEAGICVRPLWCNRLSINVLWWCVDATTDRQIHFIYALIGAHISLCSVCHIGLMAEPCSSTETKHHTILHGCDGRIRVEWFCPNCSCSSKNFANKWTCFIACIVCTYSQLEKIRWNFTVNTNIAASYTKFGAASKQYISARIS